MIGARPEGDTLVDQASRAFAGHRAGAVGAFDDLVTLVTPLLWHTVRAQGVDRSAAEDVVQTVWLRLLHSSDGIRDPESVVKWLLTTARRESWRVVKRAREDVARTATLFGTEGEQVADLPTRADQRPDELLFVEEEQRRLWEHVQALPDRCRELVRVIAFADKPDYARIAASLGMPVGSIGPTRGRCLAKLRQELADDAQWKGSPS